MKSNHTTTPTNRRNILSSRCRRFLLPAAALCLFCSAGALAIYPPPPSHECIPYPYFCASDDPFCCGLADSGGTGGGSGGGGGCPTCKAGASGTGEARHDPVNLATGYETYEPEPDITVYNPSGPEIAYQRTFDLGGSGHNTLPGMTDGWYTNYDIKVVKSGEYQEPFLHVVYPNLAMDAMAQENGQGPYLAPGGKAFYAVPAGDGNSVTVTYGDQTTLTFTWNGFPRSPGVPVFYNLTRITDRMGNNLFINRHPYDDQEENNFLMAGRIESITNQGGSRSLLFTYFPILHDWDDLEDHPEEGHLQSIMEQINAVNTRRVDYRYETVGDAPVDPLHTAPCLTAVSEIVQATAPGSPDRAQYGYAVNADYIPCLAAITTRSPQTGTLSCTATIVYDTQNAYQPVHALVDANGNQRIYTYNQTATDPETGQVYQGTQVEVRNAAGTPVARFTKLYDTGNGSGDGRWHYHGMKDADGKITVYHTDQDPNGPDTMHPTSIRQPDGSTSSYTYDKFGHVLTETNPCGMVTTYSYDYSDFLLGRLMTVTQDSGPNHRVLAAYTYYHNGLVKSAAAPLPQGSADTDGTTDGLATTVYTYDSLGDALSVTAPGNNAAGNIVTTYNYTTDGAYSQTASKGEPLTVTVGSGASAEVTRYRYDARGNRTSVKDALGNETTTAYNLYDQPTSVAYPATGDTGSGRAHLDYTYGCLGGPVIRTNLYDESGANVRQVFNTYGNEGELLSVTGSTEPVYYTYDALYHRKTLKDGDNHTTTYSYDMAGRLGHVYYPSYTASPRRDVVDYTYDDNGRIWTRTDGGRGTNNTPVVTTYHYTDCSLVDNITYSDGTPSVTYTYDAYNRRYAMTDGTGATTWLYDDQDNVISATTAYPGLSPKTLSYAYWPDGSRKTMTTPAGAFNYGYDAVGRMSSLTNPFSETTGWSYYANGWLLGQTLANGATAVSTYNPRGFLKTLNNEQSLGGGQTYSYFDGPTGRMTYDAAGNRLTMRIAGDPASNPYPGSLTYQYDYKDQLIGETNTRIASANYTHAYDNAGNATTLRSAPGITYNNDNQRIGPESYHYDGNGNTDTLRGDTLQYDAENRLKSYNGTFFTAGYNGDGYRAWAQSASGTTYFLYDMNQPVCELNASGTVIATNTFGLNGLISRRVGAISTFYTFHPQGNVAQRLDASGTVLSSDLYDAYGNKKAGGATADPCGYGAQWGYYTDSETGLILCTHRYYDPQNGRWLTRDPIKYEGGINLYGYVRNNPVVGRDPTGLTLRFCWRRVTKLCNTERCGHWFIEVDRDAYGYSGRGVPIAPPTEAANNPGGDPVHCTTIPATPAQEQCVRSNYTGTRAGYNLCGRNWSRGDYDFRGLSHSSKPNCQDYANCLSRTCGLPTHTPL